MTDLTTEPTTGPRTALDDLDAALARMQGDDSGGPLAPALDAARRARADQRRTARTELRIRREVRALGYPMLWAIDVALAVGAGVSFGIAISYRDDDPTGTFWLIAAVLLFTFSAAWLTFVVSRSRPFRQAQRGSEST